MFLPLLPIKAKQADSANGGQAMLSGYRVLDLTDEKGFLCGKIMGDLGADVIKIERPGGDPSRGSPPLTSGGLKPDRSLYWEAFNTSKRGITLDIERPRGREIFRSLLKTSHFIIESFPPGHLDKLGLGYSDLSELEPRIIMASITPFGQNGPFRDYQASDLTLMAMSGLMSITGDSDRPPLRVALDQLYSLAGLYAAAGVMIADHYRQTSGEGQPVDISIYDCAVSANYWEPVRWEFQHFISKRNGNRFERAKGSSNMVWACKDGYVTWFPLGGGQGAEEIRDLGQWMQEEGFAGVVSKLDWRNLHLSQLSPEEVQRFESSIALFFSKQTVEQVLEGANKKGIRVTKINDLRDVMGEEQLRSRNYWMTITSPLSDQPATYPGHWFLSDRTRCAIRRPAPAAGENNGEVYEIELGYSKEEIDGLKKEGVI